MFKEHTTVTNLTDNDGLVGFCSINLPSHLFHHLSILQHESLANAKVSASHTTACMKALVKKTYGKSIQGK